MSQQNTDHIAFAEFELDRAHRKLYRDGQPVAMYGKTFDLLEFLIANNGSIVTKDQILENVWPDQFVEESNLSVQVSALRKALGEKADDPRFLVTIPGKGYKFVADVHGLPVGTISNDEAPTEPAAHSESSEEEPEILPHPVPASSNSHAKVWWLVGLVVLAVLGVAGYKYLLDGGGTKIDSMAGLPFVTQNSD